jgi:uncharacterized NAD(P)/FAD-binding protein YdhS
MRTNRQSAVTERHVATYPGKSDPLAMLLPMGHPRYLRDESPTADLGRIGAADRVLVVGAIHSSLDVVLALDRQGHRGAVRVVSPHGLLLAASERLAPPVAERLAELRAAGRLDVIAGTVGGAEAYDDTFVVDVLPRGRTLHSSERYDWIVSCAAEPQSQR